MFCCNIFSREFSVPSVFLFESIITERFIFLRNRHTISSSTYIFLYLITSFYRVFFLPRIPRDYFSSVVFPQDDFSSLQRIFLLIHPILRITYYSFYRSSAEYFYVLKCIFFLSVYFSIGVLLFSRLFPSAILSPVDYFLILSILVYCYLQVSCETKYTPSREFPLLSQLLWETKYLLL